MNEERQPIPVYLIHYDAPEWCRASVASIHASEGVAAALTIIDNGGAHELKVEELGEPPPLVLRPGGNVGFAGAANLALAHWLSSDDPARFCVIGSHDLHVNPHALRRMLDAADANPRFGVLGPCITGPKPFAGGTWDGKRPRGLEPPPGDSVAERDWVSGTCLLIRRNCGEAVGDFDDTMSSYVEDIDYCLRARDLGWRIGVVPAAQAHGLGSSSRMAGALAEANIVYLCGKREGFIGGVKAWARLALRSGRILLSLTFRRPQIRPSGSSFQSSTKGLLLAVGKLWQLVRQSHR